MAYAGFGNFPSPLAQVDIHNLQNWSLAKRAAILFIRHARLISQSIAALNSAGSQTRATLPKVLLMPPSASSVPAPPRLAVIGIARIP